MQKTKHITVVPDKVRLYFPFDPKRGTICFPDPANTTDCLDVKDENWNDTRLNIEFERKKWTEVSVKGMNFG